MARETFYVKARYCKRCGRLLTSEQAVEDGYGHVCRIKANKEARDREPAENQISIIEYLENLRRKCNE